MNEPYGDAGIEGQRLPVLMSFSFRCPPLRLCGHSKPPPAYRAYFSAYLDVLRSLSARPSDSLSLCVPALLLNVTCGHGR